MQLAQAAGGQGHERGGDVFVGEEVPAVGDLHHTAGQAEIAGYVARNGSKEDLIAAVENAVRGEVLCSPRVAASLFRCLAARLQTTRQRPPEVALTSREQDIIALVDRGLSNKEIARQLKIGLPTVKNHVHNILEKLPVGRRGVAAALLREAAHVRATTQRSPTRQHLGESRNSRTCKPIDRLQPPFAIPSVTAGGMARSVRFTTASTSPGPSLGARDLVVSRHGGHRFEYAVASDERMEERRRDMQKDQGKEHESKVEVRVPEQRMQAVALR